MVRNAIDHTTAFFNHWERTPTELDSIHHWSVYQVPNLIVEVASADVFLNDNREPPDDGFGSSDFKECGGVSVYPDGVGLITGANQI